MSGSPKEQHDHGFFSHAAKDITEHAVGHAVAGTTGGIVAGVVAGMSPTTLGNDTPTPPDINDCKTVGDLREEGAEFTDKQIQESIHSQLRK